MNRQFQCKSKKNYRAHSPQNLALIKIFQNSRKTSTPLNCFSRKNSNNFSLSGISWRGSGSKNLISRLLNYNVEKEIGQVETDCKMSHTSRFNGYNGWTSDGGTSGMNGDVSSTSSIAGGYIMNNNNNNNKNIKTKCVKGSIKNECRSGTTTNSSRVSQPST